MISKIAFVIIATTLFLGGVINSAYAHKHNWHHYNNWNDNYIPYHPQYNRYANDYNNIDLYTQRDQPIDNSVDNSGDINHAQADAAAKNNCDTRTICQAVNTNVIGNGNTVIINTNGGSGDQLDGGGPYP